MTPPLDTRTTIGYSTPMKNSTTELRFLSAMLWLSSFAGTALCVNWAMDGHYLLSAFTGLLVLGCGCLIAHVHYLRK
jgi:hypothetical protein